MSIGAIPPTAYDAPATDMTPEEAQEFILDFFSDTDASSILEDD